MLGNSLPTGVEWPVILTALTGAITALWRHLVVRQASIEKRLVGKLDKCEDEHKEKDTKILNLTERVARVEGRYETIERMHREVLDIVSHPQKPPHDTPRHS